MKVFITLLILANTGEIKQSKLKIDTDCHSWFKSNIINKIYNQKKVIGYICYDS